MSDCDEEYFEVDKIVDHKVEVRLYSTMNILCHSSKSFNMAFCSWLLVGVKCWLSAKLSKSLCLFAVRLATVSLLSPILVVSFAKKGSRIFFMKMCFTVQFVRALE